jgi:hypothetical protein
VRDADGEYTAHMTWGPGVDPTYSGGVVDAGGTMSALARDLALHPSESAFLAEGEAGEAAQVAGLFQLPTPTQSQRAAGGKMASFSSRSSFTRGAADTTSTAPENVTSTPATSWTVGCSPVSTTAKTIAHTA